MFSWLKRLLFGTPKPSSAAQPPPPEKLPVDWKELVPTPERADAIRQEIREKIRRERRGMTAKEARLMETLACPNCGNMEFIETHVNAGIGFRCD